MKLKVYAIYDSKIEAFKQPFFSPNRNAALRMWDRLANDKQNDMIGAYPSDFTLFEIGEWDDNSGVISALGAKVSLGTALEARRSETLSAVN